MRAASCDFRLNLILFVRSVAQRSVAQRLLRKLFVKETHTHTHTHTRARVCVCVCVCACFILFFFIVFIEHAPLQGSNTTCFNTLL